LAVNAGYDPSWVTATQRTLEAGVIDPDSLEALRREIEARVGLDRGVLDDLREQVRPLRDATRRIQPRTVP
jgi:hypothetical protein